MTIFTTLSLLRARPGRSPELGRHLDRLAMTSRVEPGCRIYDVHRSNEDAELWLIYEQWTSADTAADHLARAHVGAFIEAVAPLIESDVGMSSFGGALTPDLVAA